MRKQSSTSTLTLRVPTWESIHLFIWRPRKIDMKIDNREDLTYVADKQMRITEISDRRKMEKAIEEFKEECLRNIGVNAVHDYNN